MSSPSSPSVTASPTASAPAPKNAGEKSEQSRSTGKATVTAAYKNTKERGSKLAQSAKASGKTVIKEIDGQSKQAKKWMQPNEPTASSSSDTITPETTQPHAPSASKAMDNTKKAAKHVGSKLNNTVRDLKEKAHSAQRSLAGDADLETNRNRDERGADDQDESGSPSDTGDNTREPSRSRSGIAIMETIEETRRKVVEKASAASASAGQRLKSHCGPARQVTPGPTAPFTSEVTVPTVDEENEPPQGFWIPRNSANANHSVDTVQPSSPDAAKAGSRVAKSKKAKRLCSDEFKERWQKTFSLFSIAMLLLAILPSAMIYIGFYRGNNNELFWVKVQLPEVFGMVGIPNYLQLDAWRACEGNREGLKITSCPQKEFMWFPNSSMVDPGSDILAHLATLFEDALDRLENAKDVATSKIEGAVETATSVIVQQTSLVAPVSSVGNQVTQGAAQVTNVAKLGGILRRAPPSPTQGPTLDRRDNPLSGVTKVPEKIATEIKNDAVGYVKRLIKLVNKVISWISAGGILYRFVEFSNLAVMFCCALAAAVSGWTYHEGRVVYRLKKERRDEKFEPECEQREECERILDEYNVEDERESILAQYNRTKGRWQSFLHFLRSFKKRFGLKWMKIWYEARAGLKIYAASLRYMMWAFTAQWFILGALVFQTFLSVIWVVLYFGTNFVNKKIIAKKVGFPSPNNVIIEVSGWTVSLHVTAQVILFLAFMTNPAIEIMLHFWYRSATVVPRLLIGCLCCPLKCIWENWLQDQLIKMDPFRSCRRPCCGICGKRTKEDFGGEKSADTVEKSPSLKKKSPSLNSPPVIAPPPRYDRDGLPTYDQTFSDVPIPSYEEDGQTRSRPAP